MRRGEIWTIAARGAYTSKPRPAAIVQDDRFDATASVTICAFTTDPTQAPLLRVPIDPDQLNRLEQPSSLMIDKLTTVPRANLETQIGRLGDQDMVRVARAIIVLLGLAFLLGLA